MYITFVPMIRFRVVKITMSYSGVVPVAKIECHDIRPKTIVPGKLVCSISTSTVNCKQVANVRRSIANVAQK